MASQSMAPPIFIQPKNASTLAPVTTGDSVSSLLETMPRESFEQSLHANHTIRSSIPPSAPSEPGASVQLRVSIAVDSEQHYEKLVKAKVHMVLVLTALVQLPSQRIWIEQGRTELMSLPKGHLDGHFVKTLSLRIQDNFLVIGFTLLVVPPSGTSPKVIAFFPSLDGLIPWAETTVAIEHFVLGSIEAQDRKQGASISHPNINFSTPLMDIALPPNAGLRKSKQTVAMLNVTVEETLPKLPFAKFAAECQRVGPSFSQTYTGHSVRGTAIYGREHLYESPLAFTLPIKLLQLLAQDERKVIQELEKEHDVSLSDLIQTIPLDHQPNPMTRRTSFMQTLRRTGTRPGLSNEETLKSAKARQLGLAAEDAQIQKLLRQQISAHRNIEVFYESMVQKVEHKLRENMEVGQGPFRRSPEKKDESVQWIPLNCCIQELLVHNDGYQTNYQTTTVGAAAAHSVGFNRTMSVDDTGKAPTMGVFWAKQEQGNNLIRDLRALQEVLTSCATEFNELLMACLSSARSFEGGRHTRIQALVKEIQFLNDEIISFGSFILQDYLTSLSTEGTARHICEEIESLVKRMKLIEFMDPGQEQQQQEQGGPGWLSDSKQKIREVVNYTRDLSGFIGVAVQHECLVTDATQVASPEWIIAKRTRECCLSQLTTALASSFLAILEDWWSNMAMALQHGRPHGTPLDHSATCKHGLSRSMEHIDEEGSPTIEILEILHAEVIPPTTGESRGTLRRLSSSSKANGRSKPRRDSVQSASSDQSFASSRSGSFTRSKSFSRHPLDHLPTAKAQNDMFWDQLMSLGWLVQIESLLSTQGSELGMLQDYAQAVIDVRDSVTISFHCLPMSTPSFPTESLSPNSSKLPPDANDLAESRIQVSGRRGQLTVSFGMDPLQFSMLPEPLKASSAKIQMLPVLFSQGINEMQTISNLTGKNLIQHSINEEGLHQMQAYVARYKAWQSQSQAIHEQKEMSTLHTPSRSRSFGPHATRRGDVSAASLISNLTSDWNMVTPAKVEPWNGENLVIDLLDHLEMAILGHADETRSLVDSLSGSINESNNSSFQISYSPQTIVSETSSRARTETGPGVATGILGSMMEFGSSRLFGTRGSKDTEILECAEALTRALGQIKPLHHVPQRSELDICECQELPTPVPASSLWVTSHVVSCKSAKDRTSMSVSLSQVNLLKNCHGLQSNPDHNGQDDEDDWQAILDAMRSEISVRIKNVERNLKLGEFAKDLLWISAFGAGSPPPPPEISIPSQSSSRSSTQESLESPQVKDALTLVRSLLPSSLNSPTQGDISSRATEDSNEDEMVDDGVLVEHEATVDDIPSSTIPFASPTALDSPPPLKLVRHMGPALEPVMTIGSSAQLSPTSGSTLSQALDIPDGLQPSITAAQQDGQYTSFPESFDEPQLAQLLARSLGLNSFGLSSSGSAAEVPENHGRPSQKKPFNPKTGFSAATTPAHRSTPSWSSQQTVYYQKQQHSPTSSSSTPPLRKRISALGLGLGLGFGLSPSSTKHNTKTHSPSSSLDSTTPSSSMLQPQVSSPSSAHPQEPPGLTLSSSSSSSTFYDGKGQKGKFAFNRVQLKFLPAAYRPPRRMTTNTFES